MTGARAWSAARLVHPYPSALNAAVTAAVALLAGGTLERAAVLGASMLLLQFAIGAANDWADAPADALVRAGKPIPAGLVPRQAALTVAVVTAVPGLVLAATVGPALLLLAATGLAVGLAYDLALRGTPWSWAPFAAGFVLLPLFAWLGGAGEPPRFLGWIVALALPVGGVVALANGLVDQESDRLVGRRGPAVVFGAARAFQLLAVLHASVVGGVAGSVLVEGGAPPPAATAMAVGAVLQAVGLLVARDAARSRRALGWEVQALGLALLAGGWFAAMAV